VNNLGNNHSLFTVFQYAITSPETAIVHNKHNDAIM